MSKTNILFRYLSLFGSTMLFILHTLRYAFLEMLEAKLDLVDIYITITAYSFVISFSLYVAIYGKPTAQKNDSTTIENLQKQIKYLQDTVITNLRREVSYFKSIIKSYEQAIVYYKQAVSTYSIDLVQNISAKLELAIALSHESKKHIAIASKNIQPLIVHNAKLIELTEKQKNTILTLSSKGPTKKPSMPRPSTFPITKDYRNIFDSLQDIITPKHSFKEVLQLLQNKYPPTTPFQGEHFSFHFTDKVIKKRKDGSYSGEVAMSTLQKEFSIYRSFKKKK